MVSFDTTFFRDYGALLGSLVASITALVIAIGRDSLRNLFYKPELEIKQIFSRNQNITLYVWRLAIKNRGNTTANKVQVEVVDIHDNDVHRDNFLPVPLLWTHMDTEIKNILPQQTVYLDIIDQIIDAGASGGQFFIKLRSNYGQDIPDFSQLKIGNSRNTLKFYLENGKNFELKLYFKWDGEYLCDGRMAGRKWFWEKQNEEKQKNNSL